MLYDPDQNCPLIPYLLTQDQLDAYKTFDYSIFYAVLAVLGLSSNLVVIALVIWKKHLRTKPYLFLISISIADAILPIYGLIIAYKSRKIDFRKDQNSFVGRESRGNQKILEWLCWSEAHLEVFLQAVIIFSLTLLGVERRDIVYSGLPPIKKQKTINPTKLSNASHSDVACGLCQRIFLVMEFDIDAVLSKLTIDRHDAFNGFGLSYSHEGI
uniref:G-protein coupled receptors family 1 profile domain-containing protein n=1 Tax=Romanomermis culicivorax TaxID=13658 RepID=A0A915HTX6_ROMCU